MEQVTFKGMKHSEEWKRRHSEAMRGRVFSDEWRRKISNAMKGNTNVKGKPKSEEHKRKLSEANKGKKQSEENKRRISETQKGRIFSAEHKRNLSEAQKGDKNHRWKGGHENYYGPSWKSQRRKALERDGYMCQNCKGFETNGREPQVHHIIRFSDFGVERHLEANDLNNLITLCDKCHRKIEYEGFEMCVKASEVIKISEVE